MCDFSSELRLKPTIVKVNSINPDRGVIWKAAKIIREGGLVAFPTETVYGLGANALDTNAIKKIFNAKGRPMNDPIIVHIADLDSLSVVASNIPERAWNLAEAFWPGPLTLILPKADAIPVMVTAGLPTVAVRMPANEVAWP